MGKGLILNQSIEFSPMISTNYEIPDESNLVIINAPIKSITLETVFLYERKLYDLQSLSQQIERQFTSYHSLNLYLHGPDYFGLVNIDLVSDDVGNRFIIGYNPSLFVRLSKILPQISPNAFIESREGSNDRLRLIDSYPFSIFGSRLYRMGMFLSDPNEHLSIDPSPSVSLSGFQIDKRMRDKLDADDFPLDAILPLDDPENIYPSSYLFCDQLENLRLSSQVYYIIEKRWVDFATAMRASAGRMATGITEDDRIFLFSHDYIGFVFANTGSSIVGTLVYRESSIESSYHPLAVLKTMEFLVYSVEALHKSLNDTWNDSQHPLDRQEDMDPGNSATFDINTALEEVLDIMEGYVNHIVHNENIDLENEKHHLALPKLLMLYQYVHSTLLGFNLPEITAELDKIMDGYTHLGRLNHDSAFYYREFLLDNRYSRYLSRYLDVIPGRLAISAHWKNNMIFGFEGYSEQLTINSEVLEIRSGLSRSLTEFIQEGHTKQFYLISINFDGLVFIEGSTSTDLVFNLGHNALTDGSINLELIDFHRTCRKVGDRRKAEIGLKKAINFIQSANTPLHEVGSENKTIQLQYLLAINLRELAKINEFTIVMNNLLIWADQFMNSYLEKEENIALLERFSRFSNYPNQVFFNDVPVSPGWIYTEPYFFITNNKSIDTWGGEDPDHWINKRLKVSKQFDLFNDVGSCYISLSSQDKLIFNLEKIIEYLELAFDSFEESNNYRKAYSAKIQMVSYLHYSNKTVQANELFDELKGQEDRILSSDGKSRNLAYRFNFASILQLLSKNETEQAMSICNKIILENVNNPTSNDLYHFGFLMRALVVYERTRIDRLNNAEDFFHKSLINELIAEINTIKSEASVITKDYIAIVSFLFDDFIAQKSMEETNEWINWYITDSLTKTDSFFNNIVIQHYLQNVIAEFDQVRDIIFDHPVYPRLREFIFRFRNSSFPQQLILLEYTKIFRSIDQERISPDTYRVGLLAIHRNWDYFEKIKQSGLDIHSIWDPYPALQELNARSIRNKSYVYMYQVTDGSMDIEPLDQDENK